MQLPRSKLLGASEGQHLLLLKASHAFYRKSLADLFNKSIETSQFPDLWKFARVTPIFKANQLYQHMYDNGYFSSEQSRFLRLHSTVMSLAESTDDWYNGMDLGKLKVVVFIDMRRLLTLLTMIAFAKSWNTMAFRVGI